MQRMRGLHTGRTEELATSIILRPLCPKEPLTACGALAFSNCHCLPVCLEHTRSLFFPRTTLGRRRGCTESRQLGDLHYRVSLPAGLRERTAVAMTTNKAVFVWLCEDQPGELEKASMALLASMASCSQPKGLSWVGWNNSKPMIYARLASQNSYRVLFQKSFTSY